MAVELTRMFPAWNDKIRQDTSGPVSWEAPKVMGGLPCALCLLLTHITFPVPPEFCIIFFEVDQRDSTASSLLTVTLWKGTHLCLPSPLNLVLMLH